MDCPSTDKTQECRTVPLTRCLPNEILLYIFLLGHQDCVAQGTGSEPERFLSTVTAVCGHWRDTAIAEPSLWRTIRYSGLQKSRVAVDPKRDIELVSDRVRTYIARSKGRSLDFSLWVDRDDDGAAPHRTFDDLDNEMEGVLELFLPHLPRCRTILLDLRGSRTTFGLISRLFPLPGRMEQLVDLRVLLQMSNFPRHMAMSLWSAVLFEPSNASPLVTLKLASNVPHGVDMQNAGTGILRELDVGFGVLPDPGISGLLKSNSNSLVSLSLGDFPNIRRYQAQDEPPTILLNLKSLKIELSSLNVVTRDISCPNLEELTIHGGESVRYWRPPPMSGFPGFRFRPGQFAAWSALRVIHILTVLDPSHVDALLQELPMITSLEVHDRAVGQNSTMGTMIATLLSDKPTLLPDLVRLHVFIEEAGRSEYLQPLKSATGVLAALWDVRPALRVECGKGCLMLSDKEVEYLKVANPRCFSEPGIRGRSATQLPS